MNPDRTLNEGVMNEQSSLKFLWEVPYACVIYVIFCHSPLDPLPCDVFTNNCALFLMLLF